MKNRLVIVDALACLYRSFYAIRELSTKSGVPTNGVYGFIRLLQQVFKVWDPSHVCVAFDGGRPRERLSILETYKAQRPPMPDLLRSQIPLAEEYLDLSGIRWLRQDSQEADDIIATLAAKFKTTGGEVLVVTSDKDVFQIVDDKTRIVNPSGGEELWDADWVRNKTGVPPSCIVDWLSLVGDSSDNIPGVPGVGAKTAAALLSSFGSVDGIYGHIDEITSQRTREALEASREIVSRNRRLIKLRADLDLNLDAEGLQIKNADIGKLMAYYERLEFLSLREKLRNCEFLFK